MTQRSPAVVFLLCLVTFGIYNIFWYVSTKNEMNQRFNTGIPTGWLLIVPIANLIWMWKWAQGAEKATGFGAAVTFILMLVFGIVVPPLLQSKFNAASGGAGAQVRAA
jgi:membrane protein YdbS with pleckstrin-like domain